MRKLMSFRKDELILPEESEGDDDDDNASDSMRREKQIPGVEDAYELVDSIEDKMSKISQVIRGMDKRMSYNLRLLGSVVMQTEDDLNKNNSTITDEER